MRITLSTYSILLASNLFIASCTYENISPDGQETIANLKVNLKLNVGGVLYENMEATVVVKGFDANNNEGWSKEFQFTGPADNVLPVMTGLDHYTISVDKWGVSDSQTLTAKQLSDSKNDGPSPATYVLGGVAPVIKKPVIVYEYTEQADHSFPIQSRAEYQYDETGKILRINYYEDYSSIEASGIVTRYQEFTYDEADAHLSKLTTAWGNDVKISEDLYAYGVDGSLVKIDESNYSADLTATMNLSVNAISNKSKASYQFSNGRSFDYEFTDSYKNLVSDKTTDGGECNHGAYTYDRNINPFRHLGYVSFLVASNYSINNRLTEDVTYIACSFPQKIPLSYSYIYDAQGYPTEKITHYQGSTLTTATKYYYMTF